MAREKTDTPLELPPIPAKRYFSIGEVSELCGVKPHVLRYWEQEFKQLKPMKRRGNRRYYQHHEVLLIRRIRSLLYDEGFTINGARSQLEEAPVHKTLAPGATSAQSNVAAPQSSDSAAKPTPVEQLQPSLLIPLPADGKTLSTQEIRAELELILSLLR
jgi:DNA-binding transcriptional MerR regulator